MKRILGILVAVFLTVPFLSSCDQKEPATVSVSSVSLDKDSVSVLVGKTDTLRVTVLPNDAENKYVGWYSGDADVATVQSNGEYAVVTAVGEGTTIIRAVTQDGGFQDTCKVHVRTIRKPSAGNGWKVTAVKDGIVLYSFVGTDSEISSKAQSVYVADVDLAKFDLKFSYDGTSYITSKMFTVHASENPIVAMNGAYETPSIYIRVGGRRKKQIENNEITNGSYKTANWKNDGAVCRKADGTIEIINTIFRTADSQGTGSYGLSLDAQRTYYNNSGAMSQYADVFSSSPLLIDNYDPIGTGFLPSKYHSYTESQLGTAFPNSEHPYHHQGYTHPRSAIALTEDNHVLLVAVDGRFSQADGFSALMLTKFLVKYFDPQYALNMDGGGSTTLCVKDFGAEDTHIVNHPQENQRYDRAGERQVTSHFYVVAKTK